MNSKILQDNFDEESDMRTVVRDRYGKIAQNAGKLDCCPPKSLSSCCDDKEVDISRVSMVDTLYHVDDIRELPADVTDISLGCGDPVTLASLSPGQNVLDLGSGGGIDCFLAAKKVGPLGKVIGVDMTPAMIEKARANRRKIGLENVEFRLGEIEHLPVADGTVDVVISNCVINLSPDKAQVFREVFRVLTPGGRLAVSDIVTDGPLPEAIKNNPDAWASCIAGALDYRDYINAIKAAGFEQVEMIPTPFNVEVNTVDFDGIEPTMSPQIDEAFEKSRANLVVNDGKEGDVPDIEREVPLDYDYRKKVFSAKITALKGEE